MNLLFDTILTKILFIAIFGKFFDFFGAFDHNLKFNMI